MKNNNTFSMLIIQHALDICIQVQTKKMQLHSWKFTSYHHWGRIAQSIENHDMCTKHIWVSHVWLYKTSTLQEKKTKKVTQILPTYNNTFFFFSFSIFYWFVIFPASLDIKDKNLKKTPKSSNDFSGSWQKSMFYEFMR